MSIQVNPDGAGGEKPTGTGNICAMLPRGYVECLFKTADTPLGHELEKSIERFSGVHLVAFGVHDAATAHARLQREGFRTRPLVSMQRPVDTPAGPDVAAFTVVRVEPGEMAEGRIQILRHRTEHTVWQPRWLDHPNDAVGLLEVVIEVADAHEAARRYARFLGRTSQVNAYGHYIQLDRGRVQLTSRETMRGMLPDAPNLPPPFISAYAIRVQSLEHLQGMLDEWKKMTKSDTVPVLGVTIVHKEFARAHPGAVVKFVRGMIAATKFGAAEPQKASDILRQAANLDAKDATAYARLWKEIYEATFEPADLATLKKMAEIFRDAKLIEAPVPDSLFNPAAYQKAKQQ
jgi:hypothetical protein